MREYCRELHGFIPRVFTTVWCKNFDLDFDKESKHLSFMIKLSTVILMLLLVWSILSTQGSFFCHIWLEFIASLDLLWYAVPIPLLVSKFYVCDELFWQYVAGILMAISLSDKGYNALNIQVPSFKDLKDIAKLSGPLILTMMSKVDTLDKSTWACSCVWLQLLSFL